MIKKGNQLALYEQTVDCIFNVMEYKDFSTQDFLMNGFFIKWVKGADPETNWFWESFLKEHPHKAIEIEEARKLISMLQFREAALSEDAISSMRNRIIMAIHAEKEIADKPIPGFIKKNNTPKRMSWMSWAALISFPISLAVGYVLLNYGPPSTSRGIAQQLVKVETEKRINPKGQKSVLRLPDGTTVWLNADTQLNYTKAFGTGRAREVYLEGEAYFDVVPNPDKPFIVRTSAISISVLGTAFNVKSYPEDRTIETTLVHGKVSINKTGLTKQVGSLILEPNQRAVFSKESNTVNVEQVTANRVASWRFDKLIFDETPFQEVIAQLERWYDIRIHVEQNRDLDCSLTAQIENEKLEDVLKLLETSHGVTYTISGKEVFIKGSLCK